MSSLTAPRRTFGAVLRPARRTTLAWLFAAVATEVALAAVDLASARMNVLLSVMALPPLVLSSMAGAAPTAIAAGIAVVLAAVSGEWNDNLGSSQWVLRLALVAAVGGAAVVFAAVRARFAEANLRLRLQAGVSAAADGTLALDDALDRMSDLIVPAFADVCGWGVSENGRPRRVAMRVAGQEPERELERKLEELSPAAPGQIVEPRLYARVSAQEMREIAGPERAALLSGTRIRSVITVPLVARGRHLGALYLGVGSSGRHYHQADLEFATLIASRAALTLDNAGLFAEVVQLERERAAILATLPEAVTVQDEQLRVVYANDAAARLLDLPSGEDVVNAAPGTLVGRFELHDDAGRPIDADQLPGRLVLRGEPEPDPLTVRMIEHTTGREAWKVIKSTPLCDADGRVTHAVNVIEDVSEAKRAERAQRLLAGAGVALAASLDYERTLGQVARLAIDDLADWCAVDLLDERAQPARVAAAHRDPALVAVVRELGDRYPPELDAGAGAGAGAGARRYDRALLLTPADDEALAGHARDSRHLELLRRAGALSLMTVPMIVGGRILGQLTFGASEPQRTFDHDDLRLAEELGRRAAVAIENARAYRARAEIAATLQASLLPVDLPLMGGWRAAALYRAAGEANDVGGDLYDAFEVPDGWLLVICDVTGKGARAAALTALVRYAIRALGELVREPSRLLQRVNEMLLERADMSLCTAACVRVGDGPEAIFSVAGHPAPLIMRADGIEPVAAEGALLGAFPDQVAQDVSVMLAPGDGIVLYTDGVLDAWGDGERFGEPRLLETLNGAERSPEGVVAAVATALDAFQRGPQRDDTAVLAVFRTA